VKKIILDTNAYIAYLRGDKDVLDTLSRVSYVYMSVIVLGELYAGFQGGKRKRQNVDILDQFLSKPSVEVLDVTRETASIFGELKNKLRFAGTPLPINDIWIASHAVENGALLLTYDKHFYKIEGIRIWDRI